MLRLLLPGLFPAEFPIRLHGFGQMVGLWPSWNRHKDRGAFTNRRLLSSFDELLLVERHLVTLCKRQVAIHPAVRLPAVLLDMGPTVLRAINATSSAAHPPATCPDASN